MRSTYTQVLRTFPCKGKPCAKLKYHDISDSYNVCRILRGLLKRLSRRCSCCIQRRDNRKRRSSARPSPVAAGSLTDRPGRGTLPWLHSMPVSGCTLHVDTPDQPCLLSAVLFGAATRPVKVADDVSPLQLGAAYLGAALGWATAGSARYGGCVAHRSAQSLGLSGAVLAGGARTCRLVAGLQKAQRPLCRWVNRARGHCEPWPGCP